MTTTAPPPPPPHPHFLQQTATHRLATITPPHTQPSRPPLLQERLLTTTTTTTTTPSTPPTPPTPPTMIRSNRNTESTTTTTGVVDKFVVSLLSSSSSSGNDHNGTGSSSCNAIDVDDDDDTDDDDDDDKDLESPIIVYDRKDRELYEPSMQSPLPPQSPPPLPPLPQSPQSPLFKPSLPPPPPNEEVEVCCVVTATTRKDRLVVSPARRQLYNHTAAPATTAIATAPTNGTTNATTNTTTTNMSSTCTTYLEQTQYPQQGQTNAAAAAATTNAAGSAASSNHSAAAVVAAASNNHSAAVVVAAAAATTIATNTIMTNEWNAMLPPPMLLKKKNTTLMPTTTSPSRYFPMFISPPRKKYSNSKNFNHNLPQLYQYSVASVTGGSNPQCHTNVVKRTARKAVKAVSCHIPNTNSNSSNSNSSNAKNASINHTATTTNTTTATKNAVVAVTDDTSTTNTTTTASNDNTIVVVTDDTTTVQANNTDAPSIHRIPQKQQQQQPEHVHTNNVQHQQKTSQSYEQLSNGCHSTVATTTKGKRHQKDLTHNLSTTTTIACNNTHIVEQRVPPIATHANRKVYDPSSPTVNQGRQHASRQRAATTPTTTNTSKKVGRKKHVSEMTATGSVLKSPPNSSTDTTVTPNNQCQAATTPMNSRSLYERTLSKPPPPLDKNGAVSLSEQHQSTTSSSSSSSSSVQGANNTGQTTIIADVGTSSSISGAETTSSPKPRRGRKKKLFVYFNKKSGKGFVAFREMINLYRAEYRTTSKDRKREIISTIKKRFSFEKNDQDFVFKKIQMAFCWRQKWNHESPGEGSGNVLKDDSATVDSDVKRRNDAIPTSPYSTRRIPLERKRKSIKDENLTSKESISCSITIGQRGQDTPATLTNNVECMREWRETILPCLQHCGNCAQCQIKPCNKCRLCTFAPVASVSTQRNSGTDDVTANKRFKTSRRYCLFNCCTASDEDLAGKLAESLTRNRTSSTSTTVTNSRINHLCDRQKVYQWYRHEITYEIKKVEGERKVMQPTGAFQFDVDMYLYCFWPASKSYFEAKIANRYLQKVRGGVVQLYSVQFTDGSGDARWNVPDRDILTTFQMNLLLESDRIEDKLNECTSISESMFPTETRKEGRTRVQRTRSKVAIVAENPAATSDVLDPSLDGVFSIDGCTIRTDTCASCQICPNDSTLPKLLQFSTDSEQEPSESDDCNLQNNDKVYISLCKTRQPQLNDQANFLSINQNVGRSGTPQLSPFSFGDIQPDMVGSGVQPKIAQIKKREYSNSKRVGARCFARWNVDGSYFWGYITKTLGNGPYRKYTVLFDDGDTCDGIVPENLYSELEYRKLEQKEPPVVVGHNQLKLQNHPLYNMGFCRKWTDLSGVTRTTFGRIRECKQSYDDPLSLLFEIQYFDNNDDIVLHKVSSQMKVDQISEHVAWGGYLMYLEEIEPSRQIPQNLPFYVKWIVPDRRYYGGNGQLFMETRGFRLQLTEEESRIPEAGLGLMLRVSDLSGKDRSHFHLAQGELLCLGPYGPFNDNDRKSIAVFDAKSFIHEYEPESYCFGSFHENKSIFIDITNDSDGQVHDIAKANLMCRVNEVNGNDIPCVCADRDPSGSIHYYLGHDVVGCGDLKILVDNPFELKIDYGELYERQRVRFGYARVQGGKLAAMKKSIETLDDDQIRDLIEYSPNDIHECLLFLESLFCPTWEATVHKKQRALILAISFRYRVTQLPSTRDVNDTTLDGYEDMERHRTVDRTFKIVRMLCDSIGGARVIQHVVHSNQLLAKYVTKFVFDGNESAMNKLSTDYLYRRIVPDSSTV